MLAKSIAKVTCFQNIFMFLMSIPSIFGYDLGKKYLKGFSLFFI